MITPASIPQLGRMQEDPDASMLSSTRHLQQDADPMAAPVYVSQPRELENAILEGRHHIVITAHLDLTSMPLRATTVCPDGCQSPLPEVREVKTIRVCKLLCAHLCSKDNIERAGAIAHVTRIGGRLRTCIRPRGPECGAPSAPRFMIEY